jgi:hypothetical protein
VEIEGVVVTPRIPFTTKSSLQNDGEDTSGIAITSYPNRGDTPEKGTIIGKQSNHDSTHDDILKETFASTTSKSEVQASCHWYYF